MITWTTDGNCMAIIRGAHAGVRDVGRPVLGFVVYTAESRASLQILEWDEAGEMLKAGQVKDLRDLEGAPCEVAVSGNMVRFVKLLKLGTTSTPEGT